MRQIPLPSSGDRATRASRRALSNRPCDLGTETPATAPEPWVEQVPHRVAEHVEAVHDNRRHSPGHSASRGATSMNSRPSRLSIPPQLGTEIGSPNPKKLSAASLMITPPTLIVKMMITGAAILGSTWRGG